MTETELFYDVSMASLNHAGEELCGDEVRVLRTKTRTIVVLSDGLGSGVKANILARLTASIIVTMLREEAPLKEVIKTVIGTLPICKVRKIAYSTFVIIEIEHASRNFRVINCDSPEVFFLRNGKSEPIEHRKELILSKELKLCEGRLENGDFLAAVSDGVVHAGVGPMMNFKWGRKEIVEMLEKISPSRSANAERLVRGVMRKTAEFCSGNAGDDATFVGILARTPRRLMVFTGPPLEKRQDAVVAGRLMSFEGRKVVCGGTTSNIVAEHLGEVVRTNLEQQSNEVPPIAGIAGIDLVTEGILTLAKTLQLLQASNGHAARLPAKRDGAVMLAEELLQADTVYFLVGQQINPFYQNPLLPRNISIRRNLVEQLSALLTNYGRTVHIEWN